MGINSRKRIIQQIDGLILIHSSGQGYSLLLTSTHIYALRITISSRLERICQVSQEFILDSVFG